MLNKVSFDWFSFTLKGKSLDKVISDLGLCPDDFEVRGFGRFGYRSMITHVVYDICIMFDGTDDMGIHVVVSGGSIRFFMNCFMSVNGKKTPFDTYATDVYDDEFKHFCAYVLKYGSFSIMSQIPNMIRIHKLNISVDINIHTGKRDIF